MTTRLIVPSAGGAWAMMTSGSLNSSLTGAFGNFGLAGRWFETVAAGHPVIATFRSGSAVRFKAKGGTAYSLRYVVHPSTTGAPVFDVYRDGVATGETIALSGTANTVSSVQFTSGLSARTTYRFELRLRSTTATDLAWATGAGVQLIDVTGGTIQAWRDGRPKALFIGDSITAGMSARGSSYPPLAIEGGGDVCYGRIYSEAADLSPIINGFGGDAVIAANTELGDIPPYWAGSIANSPAFYHKSGLPVDGEEISEIFFNLGTNDAGGGVSDADFQAGLEALIVAEKAANPLAAIYVTRPFNGSKEAACIKASAAQNTQYVDTRAWLLTFDGLTYPAQGVHPDVAGHATAGSLLYDRITNPPGPFTETFSDPSHSSLWYWVPDGGTSSSLVISGGVATLSGVSRHVRGYVTEKGRTYTVSFDRTGSDAYVQKTDDPPANINVVNWTPGTAHVDSSFVATANYSFIGIVTTAGTGTFDNIAVAPA